MALFGTVVIPWLVRTLPKDLLSMIDGNPQTYVEYGSGFIPRRPAFEVICQLVDGVLVTKEMIVALNPKRSEWDD